MSGFEIAGIVLGVLPIIPKVLKGTPVRQIKDWYRFEAKFTAFVNEITEQEILYETIIVSLLDKCFEDGDNAYFEVKGDRTGTVWIKHADKFNGRLGIHRSTFLESINEIKKTMELLRAMVEFDNQGNVSTKHSMKTCQDIVRCWEKKSIKLFESF